LNDCWPCTSWSIADYFLRPKLSFYAIARELRPITFGISRTEKFKDPIILPQLSDATDSDEPTEVHSIPHSYGEKLVTFDVWGVNSTLKDVEITNSRIEFFQISTGIKLFEKKFPTMSLSANQSTEIESNIDSSKFNSLDLVASIVFTLPTGEELRSSADWPQPLKYIPFSDRGVSVYVDGEVVKLKVERPTKGVMLDVDGEDDSGLEWSDNGFDVMPGEIVNVTAKGLGGRKVVVKWYGGKL